MRYLKERSGKVRQGFHVGTTVGVLSLLLACATGASAQTNVTMFAYDRAQTGQNLTETRLTQANVNVSQFGKKFSVHTDGRVEGQPLYVARLTVGSVQRNVMYLVTEHDSVYAFDADSGAQIWKTSALKAGESTAPVDSCGQNKVEIGITQTPIIDLTVGPHGTLYAVAKSKDSGGGIHQRLHALDITTGAEQFGGPKEISATYPGTGEGSSGGQMHFNPAQYKERTSLVILNGVVYTTWASWDCDKRPYSAWLIGYDANTLAQQVVFNFVPNGHQGAMWGGGAGPAVDPQGNMYLMLANGTFDTTLNASGFPNNHDFGNAFVKFSVSGGTTTVRDYWTMSNTVSESDADEDLGSGANIILPDFTDANGVVRHLGVGAGKDQNIYVFDRDRMGHFNPSSNSGIYQQLSGSLGGKEFAIPAYFHGKVYFGASGDKIRAYTVTNARLSSPPSATTATTFNYPGVNPAISANGTSNGILWAMNVGSGGVLHAYNADNIASELWNSAQAANGRDTVGETTKRNAPTVADGKVIVATATGATVYGLLGGSATPTPTAATPTPTTVSGLVKINSGGGAASPFVADKDFVGGTAATNWTGAIDTSAVTNPAPQAVYQSERYGAMTYTIPGLAAGSSHTVRLHMCENYFTTAGSRKFNVSINGTAVLTNFDIFATAGAAHKAIARTFTATASGTGQIVIQFINVTNNALINGIEVN